MTDPQNGDSSTELARAVDEAMSRRRAIDGALANVLMNTSNYPEQAQVHLLGRDNSKLLVKAVDAVIDALDALAADRG